MPTLRSKATLSCMIIALMVSSSPYHSEAVTVTAEIVEEWARLLGEQIEELFNGTTKATEIQTMYEAHGEPEIFDPRRELKRVKHTIGAYMKRRSKVAWDAKLSLQSRTMDNFSEEEVNNPLSKNFIRFMSAKTESDAAYVHSQASSPEMTEVNSCRLFFR
ncbi:hypothetical protein AB6A40_004403 [Gnathostoma spinigerum]|uniref:Uncharacterized protein n=1 Tax=Gnathostoma spinigerum TaxID=75299 RepID=A0ABD6EHR8_9BILA